MIKTSDFKDFVDWQKSMILAEDIYNLVKVLPSEEKYWVKRSNKKMCCLNPFKHSRRTVKIFR